MLVFCSRLSAKLITNQLLYQLSYEGTKSFLVENIKLSKANKANSLHKCCLKKINNKFLNILAIFIINNIANEIIANNIYEKIKIRF